MAGCLHQAMFILASNWIISIDWPLWFIAVAKLKILQGPVHTLIRINRGKETRFYYQQGKKVLDILDCLGWNV